MNGRGIGLAFLLAVTSLWQSKGASSGERHFEQFIRPALIEHCLECHGSTKQKGGLRLDSRAAIMAGGESGPVIFPGAPSESRLLSALRYQGLEMPPADPLDPTLIQAFETWITLGAPWPEQDPLVRDGHGSISESDRAWWAFQGIQTPAIPPGLSPRSGNHPIDRFVGSRLHAKGMEAAPEASPSTLLRRGYFDVIGLPPSPEAIRAFDDNRRPDRWTRLVDRLLADPRYGEHWSRHWLDLVRYSDSDGWNQDAFRPHIWRYRDYVIRALNENKPYPKFVREQLAGDEMPGSDPEALTATGYLRLGIYEYNQRDARGHWNDIMNEMTDVTGDVFLGMSMACARCHDHKFDPVLQKDYFRLRSFFEPVIWRDALTAANEEEKAAYRSQEANWEGATATIRSDLEELLKPYYEKKWLSTVEKFPLDIQASFHKPVADRTSLDHQMAYLVSRQFLEEGGGPLKAMSKEDQARHEALTARLAAFDYLKPKALPPIMVASDFEGPLSPTLIPEDPNREEIRPGILSVLAAPQHPSLLIPVPERGSGRRTALALWIGDDRNPLTPRVIVNRVWQQHFGQGLVATPNDFGHNGQRPSHPELFDWLTSYFISTGWDLKALHRLILTSQTWKQSARHPQAQSYQTLDPKDELLWRQRVRRLTGEQIRDAMLAATGELTDRIGGPSQDESAPCRGLYVKQFRNRNDTLLHAFDLGGGLKSVAVRNTTTTPTQALLMINGDYVLARAVRLALSLLAQSVSDPERLVRLAIRRCWGREPEAHELSASLEYLGSSLDPLSKERLEDFCHVLFNSNEFLYLD